MRKTKGITLIALIVTIFVLVIISAVSLRLITGPDKFLDLTEQAVNRYDKEEAVEKMQIKLSEIKIKYINDSLNNPTLQEAVDKLCEDEEVLYVKTGEEASLEKVDVTNYKTILVKLKNYPYEFEINGQLEIIRIDGAKYNSPKEESDEEKTVKLMAGNVSLLGGINDIKTSGYSEITVVGKLTNGEEKEEKYNIHTIVHNGNLVLDGINEIEGATLETQDDMQVYSFGDATVDVPTSNDTTNENYYAHNMVVLKVTGNLTIKSGVKLTSCKSTDGYGGPKGMTILCNGTLTVEEDAEISMTARGGRANGQNVFLWKNPDNSFEYVPAIGSNGGSQAQPTSTGNNSERFASGIGGTNGSDRGTGGGGSGAVTQYVATMCSGRGRQWNFLFWRNRRRCCW